MRWLAAFVGVRNGESRRHCRFRSLIWGNSFPGILLDGDSVEPAKARSSLDGSVCSGRVEGGEFVMGVSFMPRRWLRFHWTWASVSAWLSLVWMLVRARSRRVVVLEYIPLASTAGPVAFGCGSYHETLVAVPVPVILKPPSAMDAYTMNLLQLR